MWPWSKPRPRSSKADPSPLVRLEARHWEAVCASTSPVDRGRAESAAQQLYACLQIADAPRFLWFDSPLAFLEALYWLREREPGQETWEDLCEDRKSLFDLVRELSPKNERLARISAGIHATAWVQERHVLQGSTLQAALEYELLPRLPQRRFVSPPATLERTCDQMFELMPSYRSLAEGKIYEATELPLPAPMHMRLHAWREIAETCWCWWPCETACLFCTRPLAIHKDLAQNLHNERGAALEFRDGWKIYAWHGTLAQADIIEHPETITPERIEAETNVEIRRVMIERFGEERFLEETGARIVQMDRWGTLYCREFPNREPVVMVRVKNSTPEPDGTFKTYRLRVPPWIRTAREAVAWTFDIPAEDYAPQQQT